MNVMEDVYDVLYTSQESRNYCDQVNNTLTVRWNGDVVACCYDLTSQYILGNIHHNNLESIWNNERYLQLRQSINEMSFMPPCSTCNVVKPNAYLVLKP
jgi:radical SAM protein with 4Fe4S-binding SPASM domain